MFTHKGSEGLKALRTQWTGPGSLHLWFWLGRSSSHSTLLGEQNIGWIWGFLLLLPGALVPGTTHPTKHGNRASLSPLVQASCRGFWPE